MSRRGQCGNARRLLLLAPCLGLTLLLLLAPPLVFSLLGQDGQVHPFILEALRLDLLEVDDLFLGPLLSLSELLLGSGQRVLVGGHLLLGGGELAARASS